VSAAETVLEFACEGESLIGVLNRPDRPSDVGVLVLVGGPQYRAGSHRLFVRLARAVAGQGHACLRFDSRGMGDSSGATAAFTESSPDVGAAIDAMMTAVPGLRRVVLWGLCDAASAALLYLDESGHDKRVAGLCLLNPWVRSEHTLAQARVKHYYVQRLREGAFWRKLLTGGVAISAAREWLSQVQLALRGAQAGRTPAARPPYQERMARAWARSRAPLLLLLSGRDLTAQEFLQACAGSPSWRGALARGGVQRVDLPTADHTLSTPEEAQTMIAQCLAWLAVLQPPAVAEAPGSRPEMSRAGA